MDVSKTHVESDFKHERPLMSCRFDPSGRFCFAGSQDYQVWRWTLDDGKKVALDTDAWVRGFAFAEAGEVLLTVGYDGRLIWWPATSDAPEPLRAVDAHQGWVRAVDVSPDGTLIATVGNDLVLRIWNAADGELVREMRGHETHIYNVAFHPSGKHVVTGDLKCHAIEWEVETGKQLRTWQATSLIKYDTTFRADIGGFRSMRFTADGKRLACSGITNVTNAFAGVGNPSVVVFDFESGKQVIEHLSKAKLRGVAWGLALHQDGSVIASVGGSGGHLLFWKPDSKDEYHHLKLPSDARDLDLHTDGLRLATVHFDGHLRIHRMAAKA